MRTLKTLGIALALALVATLPPTAHAMDGPQDEGIPLLQSIPTKSLVSILVPSFGTVLQESSLEQNTQAPVEVAWPKLQTPSISTGGRNVTVLRDGGLISFCDYATALNPMSDPNLSIYSGGSRRVQACGSSGVAPL